MNELRRTKYVVDERYLYVVTILYMHFALIWICNCKNDIATNQIISTHVDLDYLGAIVSYLFTARSKES